MHTHILQSLQIDGFAVVRGALQESLRNQLRRELDNIYEKFLNGEADNYGRETETASILPDLWRQTLSNPRPQQTFKRWNIVDCVPSVLSLIDHQRTFPLILSVMGENIQVFRSVGIIVPPAVAEDPYLHTDSGELGRYRSASPSHPLMLSVQYFLTDLAEENSGNFTLVPGSHTQDFPNEAGNPKALQTTGFTQGKSIEGRQQVLAKAGDAIIFHHALWHGVSQNQSNSWRKTIIIGYAPIFVRPYDYETQLPRVLEACTNARQRRLFGDLGGWHWRPGCFHHPAPDQELIVRS